MRMPFFKNAHTPSGPPALPILGALPWMASNPPQFLEKVANSFGPVVYLGKVVGRHTYLAAHPDAVRHVLQTNANNYVKGPDFDAMKLLVGNGLVTSEGERWRKRRRIVQPAFHRQKIFAITNSIVNVADEASQRWTARSATTPMNIAAEMTTMTRSVLLRVILGVTEPRRIDELSRAWEAAFATISLRLLLPFQPPLSFPTPGNRRFEKARAVLDDAAYEILRQKRNGSNENGELLELLMASRDPETGQGLSDDEIRDEIMTFFAGGFETTATTLAWIFHCLGQHGEIERKVLDELNSVLSGRLPTAEDLSRLVYLKMVVEETMRLYPSAWIFLRSNVNADSIVGFDIPKESRILLSPYVTHRLPQFWARPHSFDPERFSAARNADRPRYAYFPFGGGPRQCIGDVFAMTEILAILAVLLQRHQFVPVPGFHVEPRVMATLRPRSGPKCYVTPRPNCNRSTT